MDEDAAEHVDRHALAHAALARNDRDVALGIPAHRRRRRARARHAAHGAGDDAGGVDAVGQRPDDAVRRLELRHREHLELAVHPARGEVVALRDDVADDDARLVDVGGVAALAEVRQDHALGAVHPQDGRAVDPGHLELVPDDVAARVDRVRVAAVDVRQLDGVRGRRVPDHRHVRLVAVDAHRADDPAGWIHVIRG
ncbi:MAG: hypothetical protein ACK55I_22825, partial [bacterium]